MTMRMRFRKFVMWCSLCPRVERMSRYANILSSRDKMPKKERKRNPNKVTVLDSSRSVPLLRRPSFFRPRLRSALQVEAPGARSGSQGSSTPAPLAKTQQTTPIQIGGVHECSSHSHWRRYFRCRTSCSMTGTQLGTTLSNLLG